MPFEYAFDHGCVQCGIVTVTLPVIDLIILRVFVIYAGMRCIVLLVALFAIGSADDCTGQMCCSYPDEGVSCGSEIDCTSYGGSIVGMCDTQCNCGQGLEKLALLHIGVNNCTALGVHKSGKPECLFGDGSDGDDDPHLYPNNDRSGAVTRVAFLASAGKNTVKENIDCPAFMHAVWSANGIICVVNQGAAKKSVSVPPAPVQVSVRNEANDDDDICFICSVNGVQGCALQERCRQVGGTTEFITCKC